MDTVPVRWATVADAPVLAQLLHDFNTEFDTASPGVGVLTARLEELLPARRTTALLAGEPAAADGVALIEINVDEADVDAQQFYERHGFVSGDISPDDRAFSYARELRPPISAPGTSRRG